MRDRRGRRNRLPRHPALARLVCLFLIGLCATGLFLIDRAGPASAKVFASQKQALAEAFPDATRIDRKTHILKSEEMQRIRTLVGQEPESRLLVIHTAYRDERVIGYAHIDVHVVRTQPEAFLIVLDPDGQVRSVRILAFHEPLDYLPTDAWYAQFAGKTREDRLRIGYDVHGVVGATLSARAAADGVRRMLAFWEVLLRPDAEEPRVAGTPARDPESERSERASRAE